MDSWMDGRSMPDSPPWFRFSGEVSFVLPTMDWDGHLS